MKTARFFSLPEIKSTAFRRNITGYLFIMPFVLGVLIWFALPAGTAVWMVFQKWNLIKPPTFVGMENINLLFKDRLFTQSLKVTTVYTLVSVPLGMVLSFMMALLMNIKIRGIAFFRTVYYLPNIVPAVANAIMWSFIYNAEFGLLNALLHSFGLPKVLWLQNPRIALPALILMSLWGVGGSMVIYLAGLQGIPDVYYEAAEIDGAGPWAKLKHVTIPLMSPVIFFNFLMGLIGSFQVFTPGFLITNGGPQNATLFYVLYLYRNAFEFLKMGYAATLAWVLFLIILTLTFFVFRYLGGRVQYEVY